MRKCLWLFLCFSFALATADSKAGEDKALAEIAKHLTEIRKTFVSGVRSGEMRDHARASFNFLYYLYQTPLSSLVQHHQLFIKALETDGVRPHRSWLVEYGWQLLQCPSRTCEDNYNSLQQIYRKAPDRGPSRRGEEALVFVREQRTAGEGYRAYTEKMGKAGVTILYAPLGQRVAAIGEAPDSLMRMLQYQVDCEKLQGTPFAAARSSSGGRKSGNGSLTASDLCDDLRQLMERTMAKQDQKDLGGAAGGVGMGLPAVGRQLCMVLQPMQGQAKEGIARGYQCLSAARAAGVGGTPSEQDSDGDDTKKDDTEKKDPPKPKECDKPGTTCTNMPCMNVSKCNGPNGTTTVVDRSDGSRTAYNYDANGKYRSRDDWDKDGQWMGTTSSTTSTDNAGDTHTTTTLDRGQSPGIFKYQRTDNQGGVKETIFCVGQTCKINNSQSSMNRRSAELYVKRKTGTSQPNPDSPDSGMNAGGCESLLPGGLSQAAAAGQVNSLRLGRYVNPDPNAAGGASAFDQCSAPDLGIISSAGCTTVSCDSGYIFNDGVAGCCSPEAGRAAGAAPNDPVCQSLDCPQGTTCMAGPHGIECRGARDDGSILALPARGGGLLPTGGQQGPPKLGGGGPDPTPEGGGGEGGGSPDPGGRE